MGVTVVSDGDFVFPSFLLHLLCGICYLLFGDQPDQHIMEYVTTCPYESPRSCYIVSTRCATQNLEAGLDTRLCPPTINPDLHER